AQAREAAEPMWHDGAVLGTAIAPGGQRLVMVSGGDGAWLWAVRNTPMSPIHLPHETGVETARFSPDGRHLVTLSRPGLDTPDGPARVWDAISGQPLAVIRHPRPQP